MSSEYEKRTREDFENLDFQDFTQNNDCYNESLRHNSWYFLVNYHDICKDF